MERGLYAAATAMMAQQTIQDTLASNIANASTIGFKQDVPTFQALHTMQLSRLTSNGSSPIGLLGTGVQPGQIYTDFRPGALETTHNPLDISLAPGQYLAVSTPNGVRYTRAGALSLDGSGNLVTVAGQPVLDSSGQPISLTEAKNVSIDSQGSVVSQGRPAAQLSIVTIPDSALQKQGASLFVVSNPAVVKQAASPQVYPGTLEQSNVNIARSLIEMIMVERNFDTAQKAVTSQDKLLSAVTTQVGSA